MDSATAPLASGEKSYAPARFDQAIDVEAAIARVPSHVQIRGMYTDAIVRACAQKGLRDRIPSLRESYVHFKYYPMKEHVQGLVEGGRALFPDVPLGESFRQLARLTVPTLRSSMVGRVLHSLAGGTARAGLSLVAKAYQVSRNVGIARLVDVTDDVAIVELREVYDFPDTVHVAIFESALREQGHSGRIDVRRLSDVDVDLRLHFDRR